MLSVALRRYADEPDTRRHSSRLLMAAAITLYARETSVPDASVAASGLITDLARSDNNPLEVVPLHAATSRRPARP